jgi:endoglucanase
VVIDTIRQPSVPAPAVEPLEDTSALRPPGMPPPLRTAGNRLVGPDGQPVRLRGVNIASLEWTDEGENVLHSLGVAINQWRCNVVRVPLSQDRWFGRSPTQTDDGARYRSAVDSMVVGAARRGAYILLDLHWSDAGVWGKYIGQHQMPDTGSLLFWQDLARRYANHPAVLMGLYNEPHDVPWDVWLNGGVLEEKVPSAEPHDPSQPIKRVRTSVRYRAVGHQELYDAVRAAGATDNLIFIGGLDWAYDLAPVLRGYAVQGDNVVYDTHVYPGKDWKPEFSWENAFLAPSRQVPVLVGEWGANVGGPGPPGRGDPAQFLAAMVELLRKNDHLSWTAWDFHPAAGPTLIRNWDYEPTEFGRIVMDELERPD